MIAANDRHYLRWAARLDALRASVERGILLSGTAEIEAVDSIAVEAIRARRAVALAKLKRLDEAHEHVRRCEWPAAIAIYKELAGVSVAKGTS